MVILIIFIVMFIIAFKLLSIGNQYSSDTLPQKHDNSASQSRQISTSDHSYKQIIKKSSITDNMNCDLYIFTAKYSKTNRIHTNHTIPVFDSNNIETSIIKLGYEAPIEYERIEFEQPTERQLDYLKDLTNNNIPQNISKEDASALIDRYVNNDSIPNPDLFSYAAQMNIPVSYYCGKKRLYNTIFESLDLRDAIAFFAFCVYKDAFNSYDIANMNYSPYKQLFYEYSDSICDNESFVKSLYRYQGEDLRYFGTRIYNGHETHGGSKSTIAYKNTIEYLRPKIWINNK